MYLVFLRGSKHLHFKPDWVSAILQDSACCLAARFLQRSDFYFTGLRPHLRGSITVANNYCSPIEFEQGFVAAGYNETYMYGLPLLTR